MTEENFAWKEFTQKRLSSHFTPEIFIFFLIYTNDNERPTMLFALYILNADDDSIGTYNSFSRME